jgi:transposase-like protein
MPPRLAAACAALEIADPRECVLHALRSTGTATAAAGLLGVDKQALYAWIRRFGIRRKVVWS